MTIARQYVKYEGIAVPEIQGSKGKGGGGKVAPNSLFSTDFLYLTTAVGEGPVYRINSNGPQDVQIQDSSIDDLLNLDNDGSINTDSFDLAYTTGTITQSPIARYGDSIVTPQGFASPVPLRFGPPPDDTTNKYAPKNAISKQETSAYSWDALKFIFNIDSLSKTDSNGNVKSYSAEITITIWTSDSSRVIAKAVIPIKGKTDKPVRKTYIVPIPEADQSDAGYRFDIEKTSKDSYDSKIQDSISIVAWYEIENKKQAYPRTAIIGYGLKAVSEHNGGIPTFTSMVKGLLVKVPSNYNQPILSRLQAENTPSTTYYERAGEIDWRELEVPATGTLTINGAVTTIGYTQKGYTLQKSGASSVLYDANPQIYVGTWDGTFTYSWTQNPVWIIYDILTNQTYGLGIPEENIDKYKFYQVAQYCDACDPTTGRFVGVSGLADGSYRYKPRALYRRIRENQRGLPEGTVIRERRFITDVSITDQEKSMDLLNKIAATFRGMLIYAGSKITLAVDMPDEYPVMLFNEATIKQGSFQISGTKQSDVYTGIDVSYVDPTNHFKRETVRVDTADANDGTDTSDIENITSLDLFGVTRRSQAVRMAQYQIAASKYQRRNITFTTSTDAINLAPGDVISIASRSSGVAYGYGGKIPLSSDRNLITYSQEFDMGWGLERTSISANSTTAPDGTTTADKIQEATTDTNYFVVNKNPSGATVSTTYTFSVYAKAAERGFLAFNFSVVGITGTFDLTTGATRSGTGSPILSTINVGNGWWKCIVTMTTPASGSNLLYFIMGPSSTLSSGNYTGVVGSGIYVWGAQIESGSVATPYIKTPATAVALEHFTFPALSNSVFTANTYPLSLRILSQASDRLETYIISNTSFVTASTANVSNGIDLATVNVLSKFNKTTKTYEDISTTGFTANVVPKAGDLWSLGEIQNPLNYYSDKSTKLFKVTNTKRETSPEEIVINAVEYISNVYVDSDTFINYQPTAYVDTPSSFATPPTPDFSLAAVPRVKLDGSVIVDGILKTNPQRAGYGTKIETEYYVSTPSATSLISNVTATEPLTLKAANADALVAAAGSTQSILTGKNGFTSKIGKISLLCNAYSTPLNSIVFTIEGLSSCLDMNYYQHILSMSSSIKGATSVTFPVLAKNTNTTGQRNFIGYTPPYVEHVEPVTYTAGTNTITIEDQFIGSDKVSTRLPTPPFYITINQQLNPENYSNNSFYLEGSSYTYLKTGSLTKGIANYINLDIKPRHANFVRFYVDGIATSEITVNTNRTSSIPANIVFSAGSFDSQYRLEVDYYTVPAIEVGDTVEVSAGNVFVISNSSYDPASAKYDAALTSNSIYRVELISSPTFSLNSYRFINTSPNPVGTVNNVSGTSFTLDYDTSAYPGNFRLANNNIYSVELDSTFNRYFLADDATIPELKLGSTSIKARNKNTIGRYSPYVQKSIYVSAIPIQKVQNITITESIYIEQLAGAAIKITIAFDAIQNQQVTDYEISYKLSSAASGSIDDFNTVKVSAQDVDSSGRIRYTLNNIDRGYQASINSITVRVTGINRTIRGITTEKTASIIGKTAPPLNVKNITGGQQSDVIMLFWDYERTGSGQLYDLDLKEVQINRLPGVVPITLTNYLKSDKLVTVSPPTASKTLAIDSYGTYTYFFRTVDTSGNYSGIDGTTITTIRSTRTTTVAAYNEDNPSETFTSIPNNNATEYYFPSFANSINSGLVYSNSSKVDNANGSSSGWSTTFLPTDLKAAGSATYYTQIRDFGQIVTGTITVTTSASQEIQATYNDQHNVLVTSVSASSTSNVLRDSSYGGIGYYLGYNNPAKAGYKYDSTNKTWSDGTTGGNVYAIWNHGQFANDVANANSYALIAGLINANAIALGNTYYANGIYTGGNTFANVTNGGASYTLVDLKQYSDLSTTYAGDVGIVSSKLYIRTATDNVYYANGNVNSLAFSSTGDGFIPYTVGRASFRYFQLKYVVTNNDPGSYDFTLDKLRYSIEKDQVSYSNTFLYSNTTMTVDYSSSNFINVPTIQVSAKTVTNGTTNLVTAVYTAISNTAVNLRLARTDGTGYYPADGTATIMLSAQGV